MEEKLIGRSHFIIQHSYLDLFGHMNNVAFFRVLEDARWDWMRQRGYDGLQAVKETGKGPILLDAQARFKKELHLGEPITIETFWESFRRRIGTMQQVIYNREGEVACTAQFTLAIVDLTTRKIISPDARWIEIFAIPKS